MRATMRCCLFLMLFLAAVPLTRAQALSGEAINHLPLSKLVFPSVVTSIEPTVVRIDGHDALCYELYIVNMDSTPVELSRVEVLTGTQDLLDQSGAPLVAALKHSTKTPPAAGTEGVIGPAEQVVILRVGRSSAWFEAPDGDPPCADFAQSGWDRHVADCDAADRGEAGDPSDPVTAARLQLACRKRAGEYVWPSARDYSAGWSGARSAEVRDRLGSGG